MEAIINNIKRINISPKRQITLPQVFFTALQFSDEADCFLRDNEIVIRPVQKNANGEFDDLILEDLIKEGYSGEKLLAKFRERKGQIRPAVQKMIAETKELLAKKKLYSAADVFGEK